MNSRVEITNCWAEYVIEWFTCAVTESCGDGAAVICCGNPKETADFFVKNWRESNAHWIQERACQGPHPKSEYPTKNGDGIVINFHDSNENFMFCDQIIDLGFGDISFIIKEDCKAFDEFVIKKVVENDNKQKL